VSDDFLLTSAYLGEHVHVITIEGELDVATAPRLRDELHRVDREGAQEIIVDLLRVPFVDSVTLGVLVEASKRTKAKGGTLRLVCGDRRTERIIEITGLDRVLRLHGNLREALEARGRHGFAPAGAEA
jgi:anti-sigma B factor antagonist